MTNQNKNTMKELQEVRNEVLHLKNMGVINKQEETKLLHKLNALEAAISVTRCSLELSKRPNTSSTWECLILLNYLELN